MRPATRNDFAVAIICALPLEADAVEILFDETYDRLGRHYDKHPSDRNAYINGRIGKHNVILCYMPGMGKGSAASVAASLRFSYKGIKLALVVGICGGAPSPPTHPDIFLGDVVISNAVIEYDFGRQYPGGFQRKTDVKDTLGRPDQEIRILLNALSASKTRIEYQNQILRHLHILQQAETRWHHPRVNDVLFKSSYLHKHHEQTPVRCCCADGNIPDNICEDALETSCDDLGCEESQVIRYQEISEAGKVSMHIGTVASADTVMKSAQHRDEIARKEKILAFEMEGAAVWDNISCIIIKGVCDHADSHKNKAWQAYAAATGASAAKAFLEYWRSANHEGP
jgi:nucleoside phosphorylase